MVAPEVGAQVRADAGEEGGRRRVAQLAERPQHVAEGLGAEGGELAGDLRACLWVGGGECLWVGEGSWPRALGLKVGSLPATWVRAQVRGCLSDMC